MGVQGLAYKVKESKLRSGVFEKGKKNSITLITSVDRQMVEQQYRGTAKKGRGKNSRTDQHFVLCNEPTLVKVRA